MDGQIALPFVEPTEEPTRLASAGEELHQSGRVAPVRLSEDDYDLDPDRMEGDVV